MITIKSKNDIGQMRESGRIAALILSEVKNSVKAGVTTSELNTLAEELIKKNNVISAFKNYDKFPASLCTSVNDIIVHGVPNDNPLKEGDVLGLDFGVIYNGWYSDLAETVLVKGISHEISHEARHLIKVTKKALRLGIKKARAGITTGDIGNTIQRYVESEGYNVVRGLVGHGIGKKLHEDPQVPNFGQRGKGIKLRVGMVIAIEPMVVMGKADLELHKDKFSYASLHKHLTAHFEHTVVITEDGNEVLTRM